MSLPLTCDGKVDIADQTMLQNAMQGQDVQFAQNSKFDPTGVFDTIADTKTDLTQQISDTQTDIETMFTQQAEEDNKRRALAAQKQQRMGNLEQLYTQIQPQQVDVKGVELANIGPQYDFGSIFRDSGQQSFYKTPYRKGGQVDNINDRLLKLIGDS